MFFFSRNDFNLQAGKFILRDITHFYFFYKGKRHNNLGKKKEEGREGLISS